MENGKPLLEISDLRIAFDMEEGTIVPVDGVSLKFRKGETLCLVGESGCGKSLTSLAIMGLIPSPPGRISGGSIRLNGTNLLGLTEKEMESMRGNEIAMIFQEPMTSLNPVFTVGDQVTEPILQHRKVGRKEAWSQALELLVKVGISSPEDRIHRYPHELSGGMKQRVMIAMALSCNPKFLIADEPTTALDVTIQAQILDLLHKLQEDAHMGILLVTHNLGVVAEIGDHVAVMYAGKIVEEADVRSLLKNPKHPYTIGLLESVPKPGRKDRLTPIEGTVPDPSNFPKGCRFSTRCKHVMDHCHSSEPPLKEVEKGHAAACWLY
ncbi:MAG: ABC transporter ATP-binding protein [Nitrospinae bacterium]|nr:ABC transporter ATP-binding protein [Nitrospinota bacterium]